MENKLIGKVFNFADHKVDEDDCVVMFGGMFFLEINPQEIEDLIRKLKNTVKHQEHLNILISEENQDVYKENKQDMTEVIRVTKIKEGFIYLVKCNRTGLYKIGSTTRKNPNERIKELKTSNADIVSFLQFKSKDLREEKYFHQQFESKKVSGEWFELSELDIEVIENFYKE